MTTPTKPDAKKVRKRCANWRCRKLWKPSGEPRCHCAWNGMRLWVEVR